MKMEATNNFGAIKTGMNLIIGILTVMKQVCNCGNFGGSHDSDILLCTSCMEYLKTSNKSRTKGYIIIRKVDHSL